MRASTVAAKLPPDKPSRDKSRFPADSPFYNKIIPVLLIGMAMITVLFILLAAGVLLGLVPY